MENYNARGCLEAAELILQGFDWGNTPEGDDFWDRVYVRLLEIGQNLSTSTFTSAASNYTFWLGKEGDVEHE